MTETTVHLYPPEADPTFECGGWYCDNRVVDGDGVTTTGGDTLCAYCAAELIRCARCTTPIDDGDENRLVNDRHYCNECVVERDLVECDECDRHSRRNDRRRTDAGEHVCRVCASQNYQVCDDYYCQTLISRSSWSAYCDDHRDRDDEEDDSDDGGETIHNYSHKPSPHFHGNGPAFLGLELEIEAPYSDRYGAARVANRHLKALGYLKADCSIEHGFEIVTHPMSHQYARESFPWQMLEDLREFGAHAGNNGLHVHVSREAFADSLHTFRWLKFLHRNAEFVSVIARRDSDEWAAWHHSDRTRAKEFAKGDRVGRRYSAVNVTNWATFEVRVFASTLQRNELMAALDMVAASVEYTRTLSTYDIARNGGWTWSAFRTWVNERPEYSALAGEMESLCAC